MRRAGLLHVFEVLLEEILAVVVEGVQNALDTGVAQQVIGVLVEGSDAGGLANWDGEATSGGQPSASGKCFT